MQCPNCGEIAAEGAKTCVCGARLPLSGKAHLRAALAISAWMVFSRVFLAARGVLLLIVILVISALCRQCSSPRLIPIPLPSASVSVSEDIQAFSAPAPAVLPPAEQAAALLEEAKKKYPGKPDEALQEALEARKVYPLLKGLNPFITLCRDTILQRYDVIKYPSVKAEDSEIAPRNYIEHNGDAYFILCYILVSPQEGADPECRLLIGTYENKLNHTQWMRISGGSEYYELLITPEDLDITTQDYGDFESLDIRLDADTRKKLRSVLRSSAVRLEISGDEYYDFVLTYDRVLDILLILDCYEAILPE